MRVALTTLTLLAALAAPAAHADEQRGAQIARFISAARELKGVPYTFGGRMRDALDGIDCLGVLFYAAERVTGCGWRSYSVYPTRTVRDAEFGRPVEGMAPIASKDLDASRLHMGDILFLVATRSNANEPPIATLDDRPVWVWHTGVYSGGGKWIVGDHIAGEVVETDLRAYLDHNRLYVGVYVLRMEESPKPRRCRKHALMERRVLLTAPAIDR